MSQSAQRLAALRAQLAAQKLDGFVIPLTDEHMSEYVGSYAQRLAWLTGFEGSAGSAVVMADRAAIFVDGRYTLQVRDQVDGTLYAYESVPETSTAQWLGEKAKAGQRIGFDPWLHSRGWVEEARRRLQTQGAELVAVDINPVDQIWTDRPAPSKAPLEVHPLVYAGKSAEEKRRDVATWLKSKNADAVVIAALDSLAWLFNIRGRDVSRTPVALGFAIIHADASADLYIDSAKIDEEVRAHLGADVRLHERHNFSAGLKALASAEKKVVADPANMVAAIFLHLEGAHIVEARDPAVLPKAIKNSVEIAGTQAAHVRDGAALSRFLHWLSMEAPKGHLDELTASDHLERMRRETNQLCDLSFDSISGAGPNGAIVHYRASPATNRKLELNSLYLIDSGGQYRDGTTDVTRTIAIGTPSAEMRDRFTRVLKGHIALARAVFPQGTRGSQLDTLARQFLWEAGLDYAHGTGHGVGSFLSVHEGPQRIATVGSDEPLQAGMILSDEPGYYKSGAYGIRVENLVLVVPREVAGSERKMLGFDVLTLAPIDRTLIDVDLLSASERQWLNAYHARVYESLSPLVDAPVAAWLKDVTAPL